jgi:MFS family permease
LFNSNQEIGLFGSLVFVGNLLGSLLYFYLINIIHRKKLLLYSMISLSICLITFILTTNSFFLLSNRIILGIFQSYVIIYLPLWCNQYGITNKRSIMISFGQLTVPIGVFIGYLIASICISINEVDGWKYAFIIQSIAIFLMIIPFYYAPDSVFESKYESFKDDINTETTFFKESNSLLQDPDASMNEILNITYLPKKKLIEILKEIMTYKIYMLSIFALSCLYFCVTGLQYWGSDYMNRVLGVHSPEKRLLYFSIICFSSPTIGVILGGYIVNYLQGYEDKRVYDLCFFLSILTFINAMISILSQKLIFFIIFTWITLLFGGAIMPTLTGIVITSLPQHLRASGNSLQLFIGTLFGYLPAPYIYGALQDLFKDGGRKSMFLI